MTDKEMILSSFRSVHIREDPAEQTGNYTEEKRKRQLELLNDLRIEQAEQM